jgi:dihydrofolate reductase
MLMPTLSIIAAVAANNCIGKNNGLLCHLPGDLKRFKQLTLNHTVIMGRKTYESLPGGALPMRRNIIVSRQLHKIEGCEVVASLAEALQLCKKEENVFVIGGGMLYKEALPLANRLYITHIHAELEGDTFFSEIDYSKWLQLFKEEHAASEKCPYSYTFSDYIPKTN